VILQVEGQDIVAPDDLARFIADHRPGDTITLTVLRDGRREHVRVTLGKRPASAGSG
jgi:S1-C subfamily serine protease